MVTEVELGTADEEEKKLQYETQRESQLKHWATELRAPLQVRILAHASEGGQYESSKREPRPKHVADGELKTQC